MSQAFFATGASWLPMLVGAALMLWAAWRAIVDREDPRRLILWGGLHDFGFCCLGLVGFAAIGVAGLWLYAAYQLAARLLAWFSLMKLESVAGTTKSSTGLSGVFAPALSLRELEGINATAPWGAALFGFGMLAAIGGSPFLVPEGRAFIVNGMLENTAVGGFWCLMLWATVSTAFIWLYVDAVRRVFLEPAKKKNASPPADKPATLPLVLGMVVAVLGLLRNPLSDLFAAAFDVHLPHNPVNPSWWIYYAGAFVTGAAFLYRARVAAWLGTLFFALAFAFICVSQTGPLANLFLFIITLVGLVVAVYSISYIHDHKGWYWFFLLLTFGSLAGIVSSPNVTGMFGYWELMTFASYFLVAHDRVKQAFSAALKYYVMCGGGALFMLPGLLALGIFSIEPGMALQFPFWLKASLILCLVGFGVKAGLVPLHSWLPEAHPAAPSSVSGPLSGLITKMGIFGLVSVVIVGVGAAEREIPGFFGLSWFGTWLAVTGAATLVYGEIMALMQTDLKKMLAYSTMGQIGEVTLVLAIGTWLATAGALWHIVNHAIMKDLLFLAGGALIMRAGSRNLSDLRGLAHKMPVTAACLGVGLVSIMGLPPFGAFYGKFLMIQASIEAGHAWIAVLLLSAALIGAIYYARVLKTVILEPRPADLPPVEDAPTTMKAAMIILAAISLLFGLAPQLVMPLALPAATLCYPVPDVAPAILDAMSVNWPAYVIFPVLGAVLPAIFYSRPRMAGWMSVGVLLITAILVAILGRSLDTLSYCFALIVPIVGAINMTYAVAYMSHSHSQWRFYCAFTCMCGGLIGMAASQHLLGFFLFWEIMSSWTLYLTISQEGDRIALREGFKYFFFNLFGASFLFLGVTVTGPFTPFNSSLLTGLDLGLSSLAAWAGMALLAAGFVLKAAQLPFRIDWQMHPAVAPTPVSGYISSVLLKSAIFGLIKLFMLLGGGLAITGVLGLASQSVITTVVAWIGGITIVMAAIQALRSNGLKLVFIYSTVSQLGYMVLAVACGTALGYAGGMLHVINHVFFKDLLFLVCGAVMFTTHKETLNELGGIGRKMPFTLLMFAIGGLSLVGVPPTSGFSSKWIIYHALMDAGQPLLALLSLVGSVITLAYVAKFLHAAFMGQPGEHLEDAKEAPVLMRVTMGILAAGCVLTGVFPGLALYPINSVLAQYGAPTLSVGLSGLLSGAGAWDATIIFILMAIAFLAGVWFVRHFTKLREVDIHTCGLPPETAASRMTPASIYGDVVRLLSGENPAKENR